MDLCEVDGPTHGSSMKFIDMKTETLHVPEVNEETGLCSKVSSRRKLSTRRGRYGRSSACAVDAWVAVGSEEEGVISGTRWIGQCGRSRPQMVTCGGVLGSWHWQDRYATQTQPQAYSFVPSLRLHGVVFHLGPVFRRASLPSEPMARPGRRSTASPHRLHLRVADRGHGT